MILIEVFITTAGHTRLVFDDAVDLRGLGKFQITRGLHVEPTAEGEWTTDLSPVDGPLLGPFPTRQAALDAERSWLNENWLPHALK